MNVIYFHLESIQNFLMNYQLNGEEVTPFLNSLTKRRKYAYTLIISSIKQDKEKRLMQSLSLDNSLYGLPQGSAYTTKGMNTYEAAPAILGQQGYTSAVFHGNSGSFWNRNEIYKSFGFNKFFDSNYYQINLKIWLNMG